MRLPAQHHTEWETDCIKKNVEAIIKTSSTQFEVGLVLPKEVN